MYILHYFILLGYCLTKNVSVIVYLSYLFTTGVNAVLESLILDCGSWGEPSEVTEKQTKNSKNRMKFNMKIDDKWSR